PAAPNPRGCRLPASFQCVTINGVYRSGQARVVAVRCRGLTRLGIYRHLASGVGVMTQNKLKITYLLGPYLKRLTIAFIAVLVESGMDLLEPWPLKVVLDHVLGNKAMAPWLARLIGSTSGHGNSPVLTFAAVAVILIATVGAISSYTENYLTT